MDTRRVAELLRQIRQHHFQNFGIDRRRGCIVEIDPAKHTDILSHPENKKDAGIRSRVFFDL